MTMWRPQLPSPLKPQGSRQACGVTAALITSLGLLLISCGDDPKSVRHDVAPPRPLTEDRCPLETRQLCDRVEAGEPASAVFHELSIAKVIPKLSACVINCP